MDIIYLLWWWVIPTIISAGSILLKKQAMLNTKSSHLHQPPIQPKQMHQAYATGHTNSNSDNVEINPEKQSETQQAPSHQAIRNIGNMEISDGKQTGPQVVSSDVMNLEISSGKQSEPQFKVASSNGKNLESSPGQKNEHMEPISRNATEYETSLKYQEGPQQGESDVTNMEMGPGIKVQSRKVVSNNVTNVESQPDKQSGPQIASSDLTKLETSSGKQSEPQVKVATSNGTNMESSPGQQNEPLEPISRNATEYETSLKYQEGPQQGESDVTNMEMGPGMKVQSRKVASNNVTNVESQPGKQSGPQIASSDLTKLETSFGKQSEPHVKVATSNGTNMESSPGQQNEPLEPISRNETGLKYQEGPQQGESDVTNMEMGPGMKVQSRKVASNNVTNVESQPDKQSGPQIASSDLTKLEISSGKQSEPQIKVASSNVTNMESSPGQQNEPLEPISRNATEYETSLKYQNEPQQGQSDVTNVEMVPEKQVQSRQVASNDVTNLESQPGKQSGPQMSSSDITNLESSSGKQVDAGGSALSSDIGENVAPADEKPSRTHQGAPAPVAQRPPPPPPPTVEPPKNGTNNSTNSTTTSQDIDKDMKQGAKGKSFEDTVQHRNLKNVQTKLVDLGGANSDYSCTENRGPLRPLYARSKYFVDTVNRYTYEEGRTECNKRALIFAEIDSMSDFKSIQLFYDFQYTSSLFNGTEDRYFIGLNDLEEEGVYVRADRSKIQFQAYFTNQPDDKDGKEDCNAVGKDAYEDPMGMMDVSCFSKYHLLCMFPPENDCINDTREANMYHTAMKHFGVHALMDLPPRAYSVSDFQLPWEQAFDYCVNRSMKMFDMDHIVTQRFFKTLSQHEDKIIADKIPVIQWWTAGRFKDSHMDAPVFWANQESVHSEIMDEHRRPKQNFTFSGIFRWNSLKGADPTGKLGKRKDVCLSFGFQNKPDDIPFVRNTNCGLPCYFICSKDHEFMFPEPEITDEMK